MAVRVKITGLRELETALSDLKRATAKNVARKVLLAAGKEMMEAGHANAPLGPTGNLKGSYAIGTKLTRRQSKMNKKQSGVEVYVGPNDPAAVQTEFGNAHQAAEPHLRPAFDAEAMPTLERIRDGLGVEIAKAVERSARKAARAARKVAKG